MKKLILAILLVLNVAVSNSYATTIPVDFEAFPTGLQSEDFLALYGIPSVTTVGSNGVTISNDTRQPPTSGTKWFDQSPISPSPHTTTFHVDPGLIGFEFNRLGIVPGTIPRWRMSFFDAEENQLGALGQWYFQSTASAEHFSFSAPEGETIASIAFEVSNYWAPSPTGYSTRNSLGLDDFILTFSDSPSAPVPEPATMLLLGSGLLGLAGLGRKR